MTIADTLDFISFVAIQCNGTVVIAELHRVVMSNLEYYQDMVSLGDSFYQFLIELHKEVFPTLKGIGSCTESRFTYSAGSNSTNWSDHQHDFLQLCQLFYQDKDTINSQREMRRITKHIINEMTKAKDPRDKKKKKFCGIGTMGAIQFVQVAAAVGLIPLYCITYAELIDDDLGPPKFIRAALGMDKKTMPIKECDSVLNELQTELSKIWGSRVTLALLENMLCELSRCYNATRKKMGYKKSDQGPSVEVILDPKLMVDGHVNDIAFYDHRRDCVQSFFSIKMTDTLRPELVMKVAKKWDNPCEESNFAITDFTGGKSDKKNLWWSGEPKLRTLETLLETSSKLANLILV